jgi:succinate-acetate transporter protein
MYSVTLSRPLMPRVMFIVFFLLTAFALIAAVAAARDRRHLVTVAAGTIGTVWAVRSIVLAGSAFTMATLPDVIAYFIVLLAVPLIVWKLSRFMADEAPRELD